MESTCYTFKRGKSIPNLHSRAYTFEVEIIYIHFKRILNTQVETQSISMPGSYFLTPYLSTDVEDVTHTRGMSESNAVHRCSQEVPSSAAQSACCNKRGCLHPLEDLLIQDTLHMIRHKPHTCTEKAHPAATALQIGPNSSITCVCPANGH
jgi:hypothetical protein